VDHVTAEANETAPATVRSFIVTTDPTHCRVTDDGITRRMP
jgi:hypothetical protein